MTIPTQRSSMATYTPEMVTGLAIIGKIVTVQGRSYRVHTAEGRTWYAYNTTDGITIDTAMTDAWWLTDTMLSLVPIGIWADHEMIIDVPICKVRRGVSLAKARV